MKMKRWWSLGVGIFLAPALLMATAVLSAPQAAHADWTWCWWDPVLSINGTTVHIETLTNAASIDPGDVHVEVRVPLGATASVIDTQGTNVSIVVDGSLRQNKGSTEVVVSVYVANPSGAYDRVAVVAFTPDHQLGRKVGNAGETIRMGLNISR